MGEHDGRVALVTGASRGIGRAAALALARQGSAVAVHGKEDRETKDVADLITSSGGRAIWLAGPIEEAATSERAVSETVAEFGRLDTLVTSAGIQRYGDVASTPPSRWHELFAVNVTGVYLACHFAMPYLRESSAGSVAVVSSAQATATQAQVVGYTATKGALVSMARAMAVDEGRYGVRVNSVSPGSVDTPMLRIAAAELSDGTDEGADRTIKQWGTAHALGRVAEADEVGEVISFLTSPRASFVTGDDVRVDGGLLARLAAPLPPEATTRLSSERSDS